MKRHLHSEQIGKLLMDSMIRYKNKWAAAGMALVLGAGSIGISFLYHPTVDETPTEQETEEETTAAASLAATPETETETVWIPTLDELNLAHYFPEGEDTTDITKSLAGQVFHELMTRDANWSSALYSYSDVTPADMAAKLGLPRERILGKYNPEDSQHKKEDPSTWTIGSFRNVRIQAVDGDGHTISPYSDVPQIMAMANVYTYYHNPEDSAAFLSYTKALWEAAHSYTMSISDVYYCSGCVGKSAEELEKKALLEEAEAEKEQDDLELPYETAGEHTESETSSSEDKTTAPNVHGVITAGAATAEKKAQESSNAESIAAETRETETIPESTSGVITAPTRAANASQASSSYAAQEKTASPSDAEQAVSIQASEGGQSIAVTEETSSESSGHATSGQDSEASVSNAETSAASGTGPATLSCPGHVDLTVTMKIGGLTESASLFSLDAAGNGESKFTEGGWQGWTEENRQAAIALASEDWYQKYGLSVSSISTGTPLTASEIEEYLDGLPADISETRKELLRFALNSVGKVPYYWGGKPSAKNYDGNHFGTLVSPDVDGRTLKGLDCSGWISWVYWSVTGNHLPYESTSGLAALGTRISREDLQPGDLLIRTGADAHVVMFLGWTSDGKVRCVHETSGSINNATVGTRDAGWPYYRRLID